MKKVPKKNPKSFKKYKIEKISYGNWTIKFVSDNDKIHLALKYPRIKFSFSSKMLNDENVYSFIYFSKEARKSYNDFLIDRLIAGLIPSVELKEESNENFLELFNSIDKNKFSTNMYFRDSNEYASLVITKKGKLGELYDLNSLTEDYSDCGIFVNIKKYQHLSIYECFEIMHSDELYDDAKTSLCLIGLFMGIPIENTISLFYYMELDDSKILSTLFKKVA